MASSSRLSKTVCLAGLFHETNTFLEGRTGLADFEVLLGGQVFDVEGSGSPLAGALDMAKSLGWQIVPALDMRAMPGPVVDDSAVGYFLDTLEQTVTRTGATTIDGVLLVLHGAMATESDDDVEGTVLERVRRLVGERVPVCGVLDLHANFTDRMARFADALLAYRTNPHTDAADAARRAALLLDRLMESGEKPATLWTRPDILWPPTGTSTADEPMQSLEAMARDIEMQDPKVLAVNVWAGFAFADVPDAGISFSVVTAGDPGIASTHLDRLRAHAEQQRSAGNRLDLPLEEAMAQLRSIAQGPVLLVEPADNIGAGASGRGLGVLKALLREQIANAAVVLQGQETVKALWGLAAGQTKTVTLRDPFDPQPLITTLELVSKSDGRFELEDPQSHLASMFGTSIEMGPCVVAKCDGIKILFTSRRIPPFDLGQLRSQGIVPETLRVVGVKAAVAHQRAYGPIARASFTVSTSGPCCSDLTKLPYRRVRRPIFPLDYGAVP